MTLHYALNCSIMLKELPLRERLSRAVDAGFEAVEFWWPFPDADPSPQEVDDFVEAIEQSGLPLVGLNLFAGDMPGGDRGIVSWPGREGELERSASVALQISERLGTRVFNALYGNRLSDSTPTEQDTLAVRNLRAVGAEIEAAGGTIVLEPVSGAASYPLLMADDVIAVIEAVEADGGPSLGLLLDMYHLTVNGDDVPRVIRQHGARVRHVQIADAPGRGAPGSGDLPLADWLALLERARYGGWVAFEHVDAPGGPHPSLTTTS